MEKERDAENFLRELGPVVVPRQMRQLVQQAGAAVRFGPVEPVDRDKHSGAQARNDHGRFDRRMHREPHAPRQPERRFALVEAAHRFATHLHGLTPQARQDEPSASQPKQQGQDNHRPDPRRHECHEPNG